MRGKDLLEQTLGEDLMALGAARNSLGRVGRRLTQLCRVASVSPPICRHLPNPKHEGEWTTRAALNKYWHQPKQPMLQHAPGRHYARESSKDLNGARERLHGGSQRFKAEVGFAKIEEGVRGLVDIIGLPGHLLEHLPPQSCHYTTLAPHAHSTADTHGQGALQTDEQPTSNETNEQRNLTSTQYCPPAKQAHSAIARNSLLGPSCVLPAAAARPDNQTRQTL